MSSENEQPQEPAEPTIGRGTYEILRDRLLEHSRTLRERADALNGKRLGVFGGMEMAVLGNERIRTHNNCVPRDIVPVGQHLLFGYNVFIGLRTEVQVDDVFSLHTFAAESGEDGDGSFSFEPVPTEAPESFLHDEGFDRDFKELYKYYKETRLLQLRRPEGKLLAIFQTGATVQDLKVFRWAVDPDGNVEYIDNRGERDHVFPPSHDFEWTRTTREDFVLGRHPHVSILDEVFVETVGGDLTIKVEDNTEDGLGIYREPVDDPDQSLDDGEIHFAKLGTLILLKVLPYNEATWRYFVFNTRNHQVNRIDAIGHACVQLPEDHGLIFPGGYYLQSGETKSFEGDVASMVFQRVFRSPNGEDVLYVFHQQAEGRSILLPYNMIRKEVLNPIHCNGFSIFPDGRLVIFRSINEEPTRVHPMQVWQTPFMSDEVAARTPTGHTYLEKVGNADLVRGISDALSLCRTIESQEPTAQIYEDMVAAAVRIHDAYYWLDHAEIGDLRSPLGEIRSTADLIVGEFEKVEVLRGQAAEAVAASEARLTELFRLLRQEHITSIDRFVEALAELRRERGHLIGLRELRYVDLGRVDELEGEIVGELDTLSGRTVEFLLEEDALRPYHDGISGLTESSESIEKVSEATPIAQELDQIGSGLELLTEIVGTLAIDDATVRTRILESISEVTGLLNRARAVLEARRKELRSTESVAEFGAQFKLFSQSVSGGLGLADTPEKCDEQLSKLMLQLEELESRFGDLDEFLDELAKKRDDVYEAFSSKKQTLMDARQRRSQRLMQAAGRILDGIVRRASTLKSTDELNSYFVGDPMVAKVRDIAADLRSVGESVKADELESRLKASREDASRSLRDRQEMFEAGAEIIKLGRQRFSVNTQPFDLTLVPYADRGDRPGMAFYLTGTDYHELVVDEAFDATREYWDQLLVSETDGVYRGEFLAASVLFDAEQEIGGLSLDKLRQVKTEGTEDDGLVDLVRRYAADRYDEGYERGLHDQDAVLILDKLLDLYSTAGLLRYAPRPRAWACLFWSFYTEPSHRALWERRAQSLGRLRATFAHSSAITELTAELGDAILEFAGRLDLDVHPDEAQMAGAYLFEELIRNPRRFETSAEAVDLRDRFRAHLKVSGSQRDFAADLEELQDNLTERYEIAEAWLRAFLDQTDDTVPLGGPRGGNTGIRALAPSLEEAVVLLLTERRTGDFSLNRQTSSALSSLTVEGLLGQHPRVRERRMELRLDEFLARLTSFRQRRVPGFRAYQELRHQLLEKKRYELRLDEYMPKVMSAFVRNRLINDVYLPVIGDNLAKQMGSVGEGKRTDQMGMLLLISPPGYGKTTLMEYLANRLGLVFVKVNGPALGHAVTSLDPTEAPNATARQEVEKINFALEMGNNVLLYLDDIQHTHPELLQKFISLCDAQRRVEGIWRGRTRTYDLRGKRFAICMAGNPYTESGEKFQIPDMLANRADTYNLGDILAGKEDLFALSYLENALTSNPILAPLTTREPEDLYKIVRMARDSDVTPDQLAYGYSSVELEEILSVFKKLIRVQQVLLAINQQYIHSAAQDDAFRTEPRFQLQGSYRNMNKLAEKIVPVMNDRELEALLDDHYLGEAQTLTTGAEHNLLKLAELRGVMTEAQQQRWNEIKRGFARVQTMGASDEDPAVRVIGQLALLADRIQDIGRSIETAGSRPAVDPGAGLDKALTPYVDQLQQNLVALAESAVRPASGNGTVQALETFVGTLSDTVGGVVDQLGELTAAVAARPSAGSVAVPADTAAPASPSAVPAVDLTSYLDKLDGTLKALADAPRGAQVIQTLDPGVFDLLANLANRVGAGLLPLVKKLGTSLKGSTVKGDRAVVTAVDKILKQLDQLEDLVEALQKIDTRGVVASDG